MMLGSVDGSIVVVRSSSVAVVMVCVCVYMCAYITLVDPMCTKAKYYNTMVNRVWVQTL